MHTRTHARHIHGGLSIKDLPTSAGMYFTKELPLVLSKIQLLSTRFLDGAAGKSHICNSVTEKVTTQNNCVCARVRLCVCVRVYVNLFVY